MPTLSEVETLLSRYAGSGNSFTDRINLVRARLLQSGNWSGTKQQIALTVYADARGQSIVTLPRAAKTILAGAMLSDNVLCSGQPMGVANEWNEFRKGGLGYGGLTDDFQAVPGFFSVFQEWDEPMRIRFRFEQSEEEGVIYVSGTFLGEDVMALNDGTWEKREAVEFEGTDAITSTKYFDGTGLKIRKPVTNGRVTAYAVDDAEVETVIGVYEPDETAPRWRRYKVPCATDAEATTSTVPTTVTQFYTSTEIDALFSGVGTVTVSSSGTTDLVYNAYFLRRLRVLANPGVGAYVHNFLLDDAAVKTGGILRVTVEIPMSSNPVLNFYDNSIAAENLLRTISGDSSNDQYRTLIFSYDGSAWAYDGEEA